MRIYEQELFIIRLTLQLHETRENKEDFEKLSKEKESIEKEIQRIEHLATKFTELFNLKSQDLNEY